MRITESQLRRVIRRTLIEQGRIKIKRSRLDEGLFDKVTDFFRGKKGRAADIGIIYKNVKSMFDDLKDDSRLGMSGQITLKDETGKDTSDPSKAAGIRVFISGGNNENLTIRFSPETNKGDVTATYKDESGQQKKSSFEGSASEMLNHMQSTKIVTTFANAVRDTNDQTRKANKQKYDAEERAKKDREEQYARDEQRARWRADIEDERNRNKPEKDYRELARQGQEDLNPGDYGTSGRSARY